MLDDLPHLISGQVARAARGLVNELVDIGRRHHAYGTLRSESHMIQTRTQSGCWCVTSPFLEVTRQHPAQPTVLRWGQAPPAKPGSSSS